MKVYFEKSTTDTICTYYHKHLGKQGNHIRIRSYEISTELAQIIVEDLNNKFSSIEVYVRSPVDYDKGDLKILHIILNDDADKAYFAIWSANGVDY